MIMVMIPIVIMVPVIVVIVDQDAAGRQSCYSGHGQRQQGYFHDLADVTIGHATHPIEPKWLSLRPFPVGRRTGLIHSIIHHDLLSAKCAPTRKSDLPVLPTNAVASNSIASCMAIGGRADLLQSTVTRLGPK